MKTHRLLALAGVATAAVVPAYADELRVDFTAALTLEARGFPQNAAYAGQASENTATSVALEPELYVEWSRDTSLTITPFARLDSMDAERSHQDLREFVLQHRFGAFDLRMGISRVFWGVTESAHLVDIINQTDLVENIDGEDKLGQPMLSLGWTGDYGTLTGFVLPYFRERTLPGTQGRFRSAFPYAPDDALYESGDEERHVDGALRWSLSASQFDLGLSYFHGTARSPRFAPRVETDDPGALYALVEALGLDGALQQAAANDVDVRVDLLPVYDQIQQTGLDLNVVAGNWLWKLEAIYQSSRAEDFTAVAGGFEYTFFGAFGSAWDAGLLMEGLWDSRGNPALPTPDAADLQGNLLPAQTIASQFQNDVFVGTRLAANDIASTEILAGVVYDLDDDAMFTNLETNRRVGNNGKVSLEVRLFEHASPRNPQYLVRDDDYLELSYTHYF